MWEPFQNKKEILSFETLSRGEKWDSVISEIIKQGVGLYLLNFFTGQLYENFMNKMKQLENFWKKVNSCIFFCTYFQSG